MSFLAAIIAFFFLFWNRAVFLCFLLKAFFSFFERRVGFLIHFVEMSFRLSLKVSVFVISLIFLGSFSEIVVEARDYRD
jgi:hypothetical protein